MRSTTLPSSLAATASSVVDRRPSSSESLPEVRYALEVSYWTLEQLEELPVWPWFA